MRFVICPFAEEGVGVQTNPLWQEVKGKEPSSTQLEEVVGAKESQQKNIGGPLVTPNCLIFLDFDRKKETL